MRRNPAANAEVVVTSVKASTANMRTARKRDETLIIARNAPPDGYTLLLASLPNASNATLYENLKFNFIVDIAPVAGIARDPFAIEVHPSVPVKTVPEFITHAKANPGKLNMASGGIGAGNHIAGELFKMWPR